MSYLIQSDYYSQIQISNLLQIIGSNPLLLATAAGKAQEQCEEKLLQKYDIKSEITDTTVWSFTKSYGANDRVYLDATPYNPAITYLISSLTLQGGNVYIATTAITVPETFNLSHWQLLGAQNTLFYVPYPKPVFTLKSFYNVGDQVYWRGHTYTNLIKTIVPCSDLQYGTYANVPLQNVFPDDPVSGVLYWGVGIAYSVSAGTLPTSTPFIQGDNRSQRLLEVMIDITLFKIHARISPMNIPALRVSNYHEAKQWLEDAYDGGLNAKIPIIQPTQGTRIRHGGNVKVQNGY